MLTPLSRIRPLTGTGRGYSLYEKSGFGVRRPARQFPCATTDLTALQAWQFPASKR